MEEQARERIPFTSEYRTVGSVPNVDKRIKILQQGIDLTTGDRNKSYGHPHPNLTTFASLVQTYLEARGWSGPILTSVDGAMIMVQAKVSRVTVNENHDDNYVDGATYFAIAGECADIVKEEQGNYARQRTSDGGGFLKTVPKEEARHFTPIEQPQKVEGSPPPMGAQASKPGLVDELD